MFRCVASLALATAPGVGWSQSLLPSAPDAGALRRQIEQQRDLPLPQAMRPERAAPAPELKAPAGMTVTVKAFDFVGHQLLSTEQLQAAVAPFLNRPLGYEGLQKATDAVAAAYREAGWLVRVYLPEQDISTGQVTMQVVEARFGGVRLEGAASQMVMRSELEAYFQTGQAQGRPLNAAALDRALLLADDLPGISVAGTLAPGDADSETLLILQTSDEPRFFGDITLDNTGARSTGSQRATANLNVNSPGGRGELLSLNMLHSQGSDYGRVALTVPDRHSGLRLGVSASAMNYQVVEGAGANADPAARVRGRSGSLGLDWSYPVLRSRLHNLYFAGGLDNKTFFTQDTQVRSNYESYALRMGLSGNRFDDWGGSGANSASAQLLWGRLAHMQAHNAKDSIDRAYNKLSYSLSRQQSVSPSHSVLLSLQGQQATQVLDSSEKFFIGGASSVRAYPVSELGGDRGQSVSAEWRWRVHPAWLLTAFADRGRVVTLPATSSDAMTRFNLAGHGLSIAWQAPAGLSTKLTWSRREGKHPDPRTNKNNANEKTDGDGTLKLDRFWLTVSAAF